MSGGPAPTVGRIVHYVSYGTPGGEFASECRAAIVAGIPRIYPSNGTVDLVVLNPTGLFFNRCDHDDAERAGGTWHWPEREGTA
jgi:hypothetical protein